MTDTLTYYYYVVNPHQKGGTANKGKKEYTYTFWHLANSLKCHDYKQGSLLHIECSNGEPYNINLKDPQFQPKGITTRQLALCLNNKGMLDISVKKVLHIK